jgi:hypothetical protein
MRAASLSDKRKWINLLDTHSTYYIKVERRIQMGGTLASPRGAQLEKLDGKSAIVLKPIGTLQVHIIEGRNLAKSDVYCSIQLNRQVFRTKVRDSINPRFNQVKLQDVLRFKKVSSLTSFHQFMPSEFHVFRDLIG